jgi:hypothetical protein
MSEYLYVFGYEPDEDRAANEEFGTDWESTGVFRLEADSARQALEWGHRLSSWYVETRKTRETWVPENYASWIEESPDAELSQFAERVPLVKVGEFPPHEEIRRLFGD